MAMLLFLVALVYHTTYIDQVSSSFGDEAILWKYPGCSKFQFATVALEMEELMGTWYEVRRLPFELEKGQSCNQFHFELSQSYTGAQFTFKLSGSVWLHVKHHHGRVLFPEQGVSDHFSLELESGSYPRMDPLEVYIVDFEPREYIVLFSCIKNSHGLSSYFSPVRKNLWVLTRRTKPKHSIIRRGTDAAYNVLGFGEMLVPTSRAQCSFYNNYDSEKHIQGSHKIVLEVEETPTETNPNVAATSFETTTVSTTAAAK